MSEVTIACRFLGVTDNAVHVADLDDGVCYWRASEVRQRAAA